MTELQEARIPVTTLPDGEAVIGQCGPVRGPCQTCGLRFRSYSEKAFCSYRCYFQSDRFFDNQKRSAQHAAQINRELGRLARQAKGQPADRPKIPVPCTHCGATVMRFPYQLKRSKYGRWFCSKGCHRSFRVALFDAFVANPESISLPQNYDEFLDRDELPCPFRDCDWWGKHLSNHAVNVHGVHAAQLKELLGFNQGTGLISKDLHKLRSEQSRALANSTQFPPDHRQPGKGPPAMTREHREHRLKAYYLGPLAVMSPEVRAKISRAARARSPKRLKCQCNFYAGLDGFCRNCRPAKTTETNHTGDPNG